ncbi:MAG: Rrf2 family transcriptional regulator [Deltaproteobacteria bacterium]|nr:Rrf2 family transcriptional regulator [Deltaproteobacteria bacterium]
MLKINRKVEYGLVAMKHMAGKPREHLTSVREICDLFGTPFDPLAHVLRLLNRGNIVQSEQGAHGGYRVSINLDELSLADFIRVIDGQLAFADCLRNDNRGDCCLSSHCNIVEPMNALNDRLVEFLGSVTLGELFKSRLDGNRKPASPFLNTALSL